MRMYDVETLRKLQKKETDILKDFIELCEKNQLTYFAVGGTALGIRRHQGFIPWDDDIDVGMLRKDYEKFLKIASEEYSDKYYFLNAENYEQYPLATTQMALKGTRFVVEPFKNLEIPFGVYLDIFPFDNISDEDKKMKKQARMAWFWGKILILRNVTFPYVAVNGVKKKLIYCITFLVHIVLKGIGIKEKTIYKKILKWSTMYNNLDTKRICFFCDTNYEWNILTKEEVFPVKKRKFGDIMMQSPNNIDIHLERCYGDFMKLPPKEKQKNHFPYIFDLGEKCE